MIICIYNIPGVLPRAIRWGYDGFVTESVPLAVLRRPWWRQYSIMVEGRADRQALEGPSWCTWLLVRVQELGEARRHSFQLVYNAALGLKDVPCLPAKIHVQDEKWHEILVSVVVAFSIPQHPRDRRPLINCEICELRGFLQLTINQKCMQVCIIVPYITRKRNC